jgi:ectoine hydroxylase-related dioxygenase (phytanoyl-CoA dioxygenase family)
MSSIKAHFDEHGYYIAKSLFNTDEVAELEHDFDRVVAQLISSNEQINARWKGPEVERLGAMDTVVLHTHNVQQYSAVWLRAMQHRKFLDVAEAILGPDIILHHSKLFQKPSERGAPFPMHQDWPYFPTEKDTMMAGVVHVSRADDAMGCFRLFPGSHKLGRMQGTWGQSMSDILLKEYPIERSTPIEAEPGDVLFFHYFLIHGSMPNRSNEIRKTVLVQLHAGDDAVEEGNMHPNERLVLRGWNHRIARSMANQ